MSSDKTSPELRLIGRKCTYNFVHELNGFRQSVGHVVDLPDYVEDGTEKVIAYINFILMTQGYVEVSGLEIDVEEFYERV